MKRLVLAFSSLSKRQQLIVFFGLIVQIITSYTAIGFFHPDQHFQVIEFSSYQLKQPNATGYIWELQAGIRSTVQVYIFSAFHLVCNTLGVVDAFAQTCILRVMNGFALWLLFNWIAVSVFSKNNNKAFTWLLIFINFSWFFPYSRSLFNSEMLSCGLFFGSIYLYQIWHLKGKLSLANVFLIGLLLCFAFFIRFQFAFAILGFGFWLLLTKQYKNIIYLILGFFVAMLLNIGLDYLFYHKWVFTPYLYFYYNISQGKASSFGEENFTYYIGVFLGIISILPLSIILLWHYLKQSFFQFKNPIVLSVLFFIIGHCLVAHKEERFLFPIINAIPFVLSASITSLISLYNSSNIFLRIGFRTIFYLSIGLNTILLCLFMFIPYAQTLQFASKINAKLENKTILCLQRTPLETESLAPYTFYIKNMQKITFAKVMTNDSITLLQKQPKYIATTFNQIKDNFKLLDSLNYKPIFYSSSTLWKMNKLLQSKNLNTINDIWALYQKQE